MAAIDGMFEPRALPKGPKHTSSAKHGLAILFVYLSSVEIQPCLFSQVNQLTRLGLNLRERLIKRNIPKCVFQLGTRMIDDEPWYFGVERFETTPCCRRQIPRRTPTAHIRTDQPPTVPQILSLVLDLVGPIMSHPTIFIKRYIRGSLPWTLQNKGISSQVYLLSKSQMSRAAVTNFLWRLLFFDNTLEAVIAHGFANQPNSRVTQRQQRVVRSFARNASAPRYPRIGSGLCQTKEDKLFDQKQL